MKRTNRIQYRMSALRRVVWSSEWDVASYATLYVREPADITVRVIRIMRQYPMTIYQFHGDMGDWRYLPAIHTINRIK